MAHKISILIGLNPLQLAQLAELSQATGAPRAALIRMALDAYLAKASK